ncbi:hypothetical protein PPTG_08267 [Phytophthora nicotianae INRA-310]|uniref:DDE Tnp4 domain-containing protein n=1 Tax=Phytophthora nicotianae (strain INRA-310) TaxID=761204 RepID=W2QJU7_PHYN3|nr:hypothetical protein PPTG_08267 [Phytophthora nicotianae INRA-310]ETN13437.1 hypothetical protein PPTG_08267 [Phytophthora nicotianae INRA-310]
MEDEIVMFVLCKTLRKRYLLACKLDELRKRISAEILRLEWKRLVRTRYYLTRDCLKDPECSDWMVIWNNGLEENLINTTSLSRASFEQLLGRFALFYKIPAYNRAGGRPRKLQHYHQVLGLVLAFYEGSMNYTLLCLAFGIPPATLSRILNEAEAALAQALRGFSPARNVWPTLVRQKALARLVEARQPLLKYTWVFLDGKT